MQYEKFKYYCSFFCLVFCTFCHLASVNLRKYTVKSLRHIHINPIFFDKYWKTHTQTIMKNSNTIVILFNGGL